MYLAPLNYDHFFKKVFSDLTISKAFLEDLLDVAIEDIALLQNKKRITDDASSVEFDFRCKINGAYVIIDMQQWYKKNIARRFYLYHSLNTSLQLESLPAITPPVQEQTKIRVKDYSILEPVITIVWMSMDNLGFKENYVAYALTPEIVGEFIRNENLWQNPDILKIIEERAHVLNVMDNKRKDMVFLSQNRLIFLFQQNIVRNETHARYERWFTFANKSLQRKNEKSDFSEFQEDRVFKEVIYRLEKAKLNDEEIKYIEQEELTYKAWLDFDPSSFIDGKNEGLVEGEKKGREEGLAEGEKRGRLDEKMNIARNLKLQNLNNDFISEATGLSIEEIEKL